MIRDLLILMTATLFMKTLPRDEHGRRLGLAIFRYLAIRLSRPGAGPRMRKAAAQFAAAGRGS